MSTKRTMTRLHLWAQRIRERHELAAMDERMLQDIGISRADAQFAAGKPFWKE